MKPSSSLHTSHLSSISGFQKWIAILCIGLICTPGIPLWMPQTLAAQTETESAASQEVYEAFQQMVAGAKQRKTELPAYLFSVRDLQQHLGSDPVAIMEWCKQNIRWVPYEGRLKNAESVLLARNANTLDGSMFLAAILKEAGNEVRLMYVDMQSSEVSKYLPGSDKPLNDVVAPREDSGMVAFRDELTSQTDLQATQLRKLLASKIQDEDVPVLQENRVYWVEYRKDAENWQIGSPFWGSKKIKDINYSDASLLDWENLKYPETAHRLRMKVIARKATKSGVEEAIAFEREFDAASIGNRQISLGFQGAHAMDNETAFRLAKEDSAGLEVAYTQSLLNEDTWLPFVLLEGDNNPIYENEIKSSGEISKPGSGLGGVAETMGRVTSIFDALDTGSPKTVKSKSELVGVDIEFEILTPSGKSRVERRHLFDLYDIWLTSSGKLDDAATSKRAVAFTRYISMLPQTGRIPEAYAEWKQIENIEKVDFAIRYLMRTLEKDPQADLGEPMGKILPKMESLETTLWSIAAARNPAATVYLPEINLISVVTANRQTAGTDVMGSYLGLDILNNSVASAAKTDKERFDDGFISGVRDTMIEYLLMRQAVKDSANPSAGSVLSQNSKDWKLLDSDTQNLGEPVRSDLQQGFCVLLHDQTSSDVWWRFDPQTGEILGMSETALGKGGSEMAEYLNLLAYVFTFAAGLRSFVKCASGASGVKMLGCTLCFLIAISLGKLSLVTMGATATAAAGAGAALSGGLCNEL